MDQAYLYKVLRGFSDTGLPSQTWYIIIVVLMSIAALTITILWYNNKEMRKKLNKVPSSWITDYGSIGRILDTALVYRSKIELSFHSSTEKRKTIPCSIVDVGKTINLELPISGKDGKSLKGRQVDCFFSVPTKHAGQVIFYRFTTTVTKYHPKGSNLSIASLMMPDHLEQTQNREFLRVSPPSRFYDYVNIIPDTDQGMKACLKYIKSKGEFSPGYIGGGESKTLLADISGGGVSLEVTSITNRRARALNLAKGQNFLVLLGLVDTGTRGIIRYLFRCKIRRFYLDPVQAKAQLGLSFEAQFKGFDEDSGKPSWVTLKKGGSREMDDWSYNVHLELYREGVE